MGKYSKKRQGSTKRVLLIILCVVLALVLAAMLLATIYVENLFSRLNHVGGGSNLPSGGFDGPPVTVDTVPSDFTGPVLNGDDVQTPTGPVQVVGEKHINILLIGNDARDGDTAPRSDSMILCTFNTETKTITMTSFLRDTYVQIPNFNRGDKLTHAFHWGGYYGTSMDAGNGGIASAIEVLDSTLEYNFGVKIDGNLCVDFAAFEKVIDQVGGVDIDLTEKEARHLNKRYGFSLSSGINRLNGKEALGYARIRDIDSDIVRAGRQRTVVMALIDKARGMNFVQLNDLLMEVLPMITTDMSDQQIMEYAMALFPMLGGCKTASQQIPMEGTYSFAYVDDLAVERIDDLEANLELLRQTIGY